jgi:hypothetical protein
MVYRVRKQLVEEGFEAVLNRKQRATPAIARIFGGKDCVAEDSNAAAEGIHQVPALRHAS